MTQPVQPIGRRVDLESLPRGGRRVQVPVAPLASEEAPSVMPDPADHQNPVPDHIGDNDGHNLEALVFPGELLTTSTTLAVLLGDDSKESYFGAKFSAVVQEGETHEHVIDRSITVVNETVYANIQDVLDIIAAQDRTEAMRAELVKANIAIPADATDEMIEQLYTAASAQ